MEIRDTAPFDPRALEQDRSDPRRAHGDSEAASHGEQRCADRRARGVGPWREGRDRGPGAQYRCGRAGYVTLGTGIVMHDCGGRCRWRAGSAAANWMSTAGALRSGARIVTPRANSVMKSTRRASGCCGRGGTSGGTLRIEAGAGGSACEFRYSSVVMVATVWKTSQLDGACVTKQDLMIVFDLPIYD